MTDPTQTTPAAGEPAPAAVTPEATPTTTPSQTAPAPAAKSIIPEEPTAAPPPEPTPEPKPDDGPEWMLYEGIKGTGKMPDWFKADKYKTVAAQAEAYAHLEKRLGAFVGAPKDGKYETPTLPEGVTGEFDNDHPLIQTFTGWASENQLSQKAYNELLGMFAQYEAAQTPNMNDVKAELGKDADQRLGDVATWARANLTGDEFNTFREAMGDRNAAVVFRAVESVIARTRQPNLPKPGRDSGDAPVGGLAAIHEMQAKLGPDGKRLYETDPKYRAMVEKKRVEYFESQTAA